MAEPIHIGHIIQEELRQQGRSVAWLARQLNTSRMACYRIFHCYSIDTQVLYRISSFLGKNFFEVYSQGLEKTGILLRNWHRIRKVLSQHDKSVINRKTEGQMGYNTGLLLWENIYSFFCCPFKQWFLLFMLKTRHLHPWLSMTPSSHLLRTMLRWNTKYFPHLKQTILYQSLEAVKR